MAYSGIMTALYQREKTGKGQYVEASLLESMVSAANYHIVNYLGTGNVPGASRQNRIGTAAAIRTTSATTWQRREVTPAPAGVVGAPLAPRDFTSPAFVRAGLLCRHELIAEHKRSWRYANFRRIPSREPGAPPVAPSWTKRSRRSDMGNRIPAQRWRRRIHRARRPTKSRDRAT